MNDEIKQIINRYGITSRDNLIPVLQDLQERFGFLPKQAIAELAGKMDISVAKIHGIITFYNQFSYEPKGQFHIRICRGTTCHMNQSGIILESLKNKLEIQAGQTTSDNTFSLEIVPCLGACGQGPVLAVNDEYYTQVDQKALEEIISLYQNMKQ